MASTLARAALASRSADAAGNARERPERYPYSSFTGTDADFAHSVARKRLSSMKLRNASRSDDGFPNLGAATS
jgi:hypothetical protein